jgi:hypothetical protein
MYRSDSRKQLSGGVQPIKARTGRGSSPKGSTPAANVAGKGSSGMGSGTNCMSHGERCASASNVMGKS